MIYILIGHKIVDITSELTCKIGNNNEYKYWTIYNGLNYSGYCMNINCDIGGEPQCIPRRYGTINVYKEIKNGKIKCQDCGELIRLKSIDLFNCSSCVLYKISGNNNTIQSKHFIVKNQDIKRFGFKGTYNKIDIKNVETNDNKSIHYYNSISSKKYIQMNWIVSPINNGIFFE